MRLVSLGSNNYYEKLEFIFGEDNILRNLSFCDGIIYNSRTMNFSITNVGGTMLPSNEASVTFSYEGDKVNCNVRLVDLETELCVYQTNMELASGISYWIGISPGIALHLNDCRVEFHSNGLVYEHLISLGNPTQKYLVNNRKFFPKTNGDPAFQTFSEVEIWKIYDDYGISVEPGDVVVDIGANYGFFSIYASKKGASKIFSVEPFANTVECLAENTKSLDNVYILPVAISDVIGEEEFVQTDVFGSNFLLKNSHLLDQDLEKRSIIKVPTTTLQSIINNFSIEKIDFLKVDCEGGEINLFTTLPEQCLRKLNKIVIEYHSESGKEILAEILEQFNFSFTVVQKENSCGMIYCKANF